MSSKEFTSIEESSNQAIHVGNSKPEPQTINLSVSKPNGSIDSKPKFQSINLAVRKPDGSIGDLILPTYSFSFSIPPKEQNIQQETRQQQQDRQWSEFITSLRSTNEFDDFDDFELETARLVEPYIRPGGDN